MHAGSMPPPPGKTLWRPFHKQCLVGELLLQVRGIERCRRTCAACRAGKAGWQLGATSADVLMVGCGSGMRAGTGTRWPIA